MLIMAAIFLLQQTGELQRKTGASFIELVSIQSLVGISPSHLHRKAPARFAFNLRRFGAKIIS